VPAAVFEQVQGAAQVVFDQLGGGATGVGGAGEHAGLGGAVEHGVARGQVFEIGREADIAVDDTDPKGAEGAEVVVGALAGEVVDAVDFQAGALREEGAGEGGAGEAADAGDEDFHGGVTGAA